MLNETSETGGTTAPDHVGDYLNAFRAGQRLTPSARPNPVPEFLATATAGPLATLSGAERDQAGRRAELLGAIGVGLSNVPYDQRPSILAHLAPALESEGIPAQAVTGFDPTDEALDLSIKHAKAAAGLLKKA